MSTMFLIYVFMTIPKLVWFFSLMTIVCLFFAGGVAIHIHDNLGDDYGDTEKSKEDKAEKKKAAFKQIKRFLISAPICFLFAFIIPDKNTTYVLAGAYVAEKTVNSEIGQDVISLVHKNIKDALRESK